MFHVKYLSSSVYGLGEDLLSFSLVAKATTVLYVIEVFEHL